MTAKCHMKDKTLYVCNQCAYETKKWTGRCLSCGQYNTMEEVEVPVAPVASAASRASAAMRIPARAAMAQATSPVHARDENGLRLPPRLQDISEEDDAPRMASGLSELDTVLNGGIVPGSLTLLGGDPGIGKSTLLLQICRQMDAAGRTCLYVSGEESARQIKMRASRLGVDTSRTYILAETNMEAILQAIAATKPHLVMIDSIQTVSSGHITSVPGSVGQIRECTAQLMAVAKDTHLHGGATGPAVVIVGHVTKEGALAGPRLLEHMVDTVLYFEGERRESYRLIRAVKNRFGANNEIAVFEMAEKGLQEINNPSAYMLAGRPASVSGSAITCCLEGTRPILAEVQALCSFTQFGTPRRTATGMDYNRVVMLMAVLEKRAGYKLQTFDSYVNVAGGMKIMEPAADAAVVAALASSCKNTALNPETVVLGEIGLTGELRAVNRVDRRVQEAQKLGFSQCVVPQAHLKSLRVPEGIRVFGAANIQELLELVM